MCLYSVLPRYAAHWYVSGMYCEPLWDRVNDLMKGGIQVIASLIHSYSCYMYKCDKKGTKCIPMCPSYTFICAYMCPWWYLFLGDIVLFNAIRQSEKSQLQVLLDLWQFTFIGKSQGKYLFQESYHRFYITKDILSLIN